MYREFGNYYIREYSYSKWILAYWDGYVFTTDGEIYMDYNLHEIDETPMFSF
jgi:hypothetical protein